MVVLLLMVVVVVATAAVGLLQCLQSRSGRRCTKRRRQRQVGAGNADEFGGRHSQAHTCEQCVTSAHSADRTHNHVL